MEFEAVVAQQLRDLGYPVFYRNYKILYQRSAISEFDIVSYGFIVEVKSGRDYGTRGLDFMHSYGILPKEFKYYIYCPVLNDQEIACLNENLARGPISYINSYSPIIENHTPNRDCVITEETILANFLNLRMCDINSFGTLYITPKIYDQMVYRVHHERDRYSYTDNLKWSEKLAYLMKNKRICLDKAPPHIPLMIKAYKNMNVARLKRYERFTIPQVYYINMMPKDKDMVDIHL